jgi:hypothetical protein
MASISMEQKQVQADAREELLKAITEATKSTDNASTLRTLAEAYALVVAPSRSSGASE